MAEITEVLHVAAALGLDPQVLVVRIGRMRIVTADALQLAIAQKLGGHGGDLSVNLYTIGVAVIGGNRHNAHAAIVLVTAQAQSGNAAEGLVATLVNGLGVRGDGEDYVTLCRMNCVAANTIQSIMRPGGKSKCGD